MRQIPAIKPRVVAPFNPKEYSIVRHPRAYSKSVACKRNQHVFNQKKIINGLPHLICSKCGDAIVEGLHNKTWSKRDIHDTKRIIKGKREPRTNKEIILDSWDKLEYLRSKGLTDDDIKKIYRKKQMGLI